MVSVLACTILFAIAADADNMQPSSPNVCTVRELNEVRFSDSSADLLLSTGVVQSVCNSFYVIEDDTGRSKFKSQISPKPIPGDIIEVVCKKHIPHDFDKYLTATKLTIIGKGHVTQPLSTSLGDLDERHDDLRLVTVNGTVVSAFSDQIDAKYDILLLKDGAVRMPLFVAHSDYNERLSGARIRVTAEYNRLVSGMRRFSGPFLFSSTNDITVLCPPPVDFFNAPPLNPGDYVTPKEVADMDIRTLEGDVVAIWNGNQFMMQIGELFANVRLSHGVPLPTIGSRVCAAGYPETDLYKINLTSAQWKQLPTSASATERAKPTPLQQAFCIHNGILTADPTFNGRLVCLRGIARGIPPDDSVQYRFFIDVGKCNIPIDISACPDALSGIRSESLIEVTGRCLFETSAWQPYDVLPQITGITVLLCMADDLRVLKTPSQWTSFRLMILVFSLVALLTAILIWNISLNRLAERRGRQLSRAEIGRVCEALRVEERTRLAVELHDSLSQNLTGVALQINAGRYDLAARTLKSCREELRNCLWDLRTNAIDCDSMDEAIRQALEPHAEDICVSIRFNVPRNMLSDNTAYVILRIIRELVVNAARHGKATSVKVAGCVEPHQLLFSVKDNGCGFDPINHPGISEGHFGLQGINERVAALDGKVTISSQLDKGSEIVVAIPMNNVSNSKPNRK